MLQKLESRADALPKKYIHNYWQTKTGKRRLLQLLDCLHFDCQSSDLLDYCCYYLVRLPPLLLPPHLQLWVPWPPSLALIMATHREVLVCSWTPPTHCRWVNDENHTEPIQRNARRPQPNYNAQTTKNNIERIFQRKCFKRVRAYCRRYINEWTTPPTVNEYAQWFEMPYLKKTKHAVCISARNHHWQNHWLKWKMKWTQKESRIYNYLNVNVSVREWVGVNQDFFKTHFWCSLMLQ